MKQNLRKALALVALSVSVGSLTCGSVSRAETLAVDQAYLQSVADFLISNWNGMESAAIAEYAAMDTDDAEMIVKNYGLPFTAEAFTTAFASYDSTAESPLASEGGKGRAQQPDKHQFTGLLSRVNQHFIFFFSRRDSLIVNSKSRFAKAIRSSFWIIRPRRPK